jgi:hypothetical protein
VVIEITRILNSLLGMGESSSPWVRSFFKMGNELVANPDGVHPTTGVTMVGENTKMLNEMTEHIQFANMLSTKKHLLLKFLFSKGVTVPAIEEIKETFSMIPTDALAGLVDIASQIVDVYQMQHLVTNCVCRLPAPTPISSPTGSGTMPRSYGIVPHNINFGTGSPQTPTRMSQPPVYTPATKDQANSRVYDVMGDMASNLMMDLRRMLDEQITLDGSTVKTSNTEGIVNQRQVEVKVETRTPDIMKTIHSNMKLVPLPEYDINKTRGCNFRTFIEYALQTYSIQEDENIEKKIWGSFLLTLGTFLKPEQALYKASKDKRVKVHREGVSILRTLAQIVLRGGCHGIMEEERKAATLCVHRGEQGDYRGMYDSLEEFEEHTDTYLMLLKVMADPEIALSNLHLTGTDTDTSWMTRHVRSHILGPIAQAMTNERYVPGNRGRCGSCRMGRWDTDMVA